MDDASPYDAKVAHNDPENSVRTNRKNYHSMMKKNKSFNPRRDSNESFSGKLGKSPYIFNKDKPILPYENDCPSLKGYITENFHDSELIDYDLLHRLYDRLQGGMTKTEICEEIREDSQKTWKFLSEFVILRESIL